MSHSENNLIWIDLEMTGLDTDNDLIIEIATIVTDPQLNIVEEGPVMAIFQSDEILNQMDEWNTRQHNQSGLVERIKNSSYDVAEAESLTLAFLKKFVPKGKSPMCGNSICQDRRFMHRLMPELEAYFHYRNLDVSSIKEITKRWAPNAEEFNKQGSHLAMDDIRDSINELQFYREHVFKI
jgi:oligoribonuclease